MQVLATSLNLLIKKVLHHEAPIAAPIEKEKKVASSAQIVANVLHLQLGPEKLQNQ
jgi:hypothetical protein